MERTRRTHQILSAAAVVSLLATACGSGGGDGVQIGLKKISLDLSFEAEKEEAKPAPSVALEPTAVPGQAEVAVVVPPQSFERKAQERPPVPPVAVTVPCPGPPEGAVPAEPVDVVINKPIRPGRYVTRVGGYFVVEGGSFVVKGDLPPMGTFTIRNVVQAKSFGLNERADTFEVFRPGVGTNFTSTSLRLGPANLVFLKQVTKTDKGESTFAPAGNPKYMNLGMNGQGQTWTEAGTDPATGASIVIEGIIAAEERVKLCDDIVQAWRVETSERIVDVQSGLVSQTTNISGVCRPSPSGAPCKPSKNVRWIATQYGGLIVREDLHLQVQQNGVTTFIEKSETLNSLAVVSEAK